MQATLLLSEFGSKLSKYSEMSLLKKVKIESLERFSKCLRFATSQISSLTSNYTEKAAGVTNCLFILSLYCSLRDLKRSTAAKSSIAVEKLMIIPFLKRLTFLFVSSCES